MDAVLSVPLFAAFAVATFVALVLLRKTWLFWIPGMAWIGYGAAIYVAWPWYDTHDGAGFEGLSNFLHVVITVVVVTAGLVFLFVAARSYKRPRSAELPTAIVTRRD